MQVFIDHYEIPNGSFGRLIPPVKNVSHLCHSFRKGASSCFSIEVSKKRISFDPLSHATKTQHVDPATCRFLLCLVFSGPVDTMRKDHHPRSLSHRAYTSGFPFSFPRSRLGVPGMAEYPCGRTPAKVRQWHAVVLI